MKARFKISGREQLCNNYPNCRCNGHLVYENVKKKSQKRGFTNKKNEEI
jgi:hypothetical protein